MLNKIAEFFGGGYKGYVRECESRGEKPLGRNEWQAQKEQAPKKSC